MAQKYIPLISSGVAGPLGVLHLPRLWQKLLLGTRDQLHEDWDTCGKGFDQMVLDGIGLDRDKTIAFVKDKGPSYAQFETFVKANASKLDKASIEKSNAAVVGYNHADGTRKSILSDAGISDEGKILDAVNLNNLEDWSSFHKSVVG